MGNGEDQAADSTLDTNYIADFKFILIMTHEVSIEKPIIADL